MKVYSIYVNNLWNNTIAFEVIDQLTSDHAGKRRGNNQNFTNITCTPSKCVGVLYDMFKIKIIGSEYQLKITYRLILL